MAPTSGSVRAGPRPLSWGSPPTRRGRWPGRSGSRSAIPGLAGAGCTYPLEDFDESERLLERVEVELEGGHPLREGGRDNQDSGAEEEGDRRDTAARRRGRAGGAGSGRRTREADPGGRGAGRRRLSGSPRLWGGDGKGQPGKREMSWGREGEEPPPAAPGRTG